MLEGGRGRRLENCLRKTKNKHYLFAPTPKIMEIFDGVISSENLCILSEMKTGSPLSVWRVMLQASAKQISQVVEL